MFFRDDFVLGEEFRRRRRRERLICECREVRRERHHDRRGCHCGRRREFECRCRER